MSDAPKSGPMRSLGRKTIRPSAKPSSLMDDPFELAGIWQARIVTLFPEAFPGVLGLSLTGKALTDGKWQLFTHDLRTFGIGRHRNVDDTPAGGGAGMVMRADVVGPALAEAQHHAHGRWPILYMSPRGRPFDQAMARDLARCQGVTVLCGRFEGYDERIFAGRGVEEVSIGDIVLSGGEPAALMLLDACIRLLPGVMGAASSGAEESFENGLLEYPHYTRPATWEGRTIPEVLRSGDHAKIAAWRKSQSEIDTRLRRPDLWERHCDARVQSASGAQAKKKD